jgi:hypothetical protein
MSLLYLCALSYLLLLHAQQRASFDLQWASIVVGPIFGLQLAMATIPFNKMGGGGGPGPIFVTRSRHKPHSESKNIDF